MKEEWLKALNAEIIELKNLTLETRRMTDSAAKTARAAQQQAHDSRYSLEKHIEWHNKTIWKRWFGLK